MEIAILRAKNIYKVIPRPFGRNVVGSKWVYAIKWKEDSDLEKQKARTVAKGFT